MKRSTPEGIELRNQLMEAVTTTGCTGEEVLGELTAALACTVAFTKAWSLERLLEEVRTMYEVTVEMEELQLLNPFANPDTINADA